MTVTELAKLNSLDGKENTMEDRLQQAVDELKRAPGALRASGYRCIERVDEFVLAVEWESIDAHLAFRDSTAFATYRSHISDVVGGPAEFAHYRLVAQ